MSGPDGPLAELRTLPFYYEPLKKPRPFLVPAEGDQVIEILPAEKENRKIKFQEEILVTEIEDRFFHYGYELEEEEEEAYEIEIVEDDGDADFYLEIVDGEVFYVFETEDDMSEDSMDELLSGDEESAASSFESSMHSGTSDFSDAYDLADLVAPNLDGTDGEDRNPAMLQEIPFPDEIKLNKQPSLDDETSEINQADFILDMEDDGMDGGSEIEIPEAAKKDMERHSADKEVRRKKREGKKQAPPESSEGSMSSSSSSSSSSTTSSSTKSKKQEAGLIPQVPAIETTQESGGEPFAKDTAKPAPTRQPSMSPPPSPVGTPPTSPDGGTSSLNGSLAHMSPTSRGKSILKTNVPSPLAETQKIVCKKDGAKSKKPGITKTYVRAEQFDGEHRVYSWQKPAWTQGDQLAPTEQGEKVRQGGNLAGPITHVGKEANEDGSSSPNASGKGVEVDKEEILRRFVSGEIGGGLMSNTRQRKLKLSVNGAKLREGGDIVKPITKATVFRTPNDINHVANPGVLRPTPKTNKTKEYTWAKPDWTQGRKLKSTNKGAAIKEGADLQTPITQRVIADAEAATAANRRLQQKTQLDSHKVMDSSSHHLWKQPQLSKSTEGVNGLKKISNHSSEHSKEGPGPAEAKDCSDDPDAQRRRRQELLARVAKSWG